MQIQLSKKYIDKMGNISTIKKHKNFYGIIEGRFDLVHIDNIHFEKKRTVGVTTFEISKEGKLVDSPDNCVYNPDREFTFFDNIKLFIS